MLGADRLDLGYLSAGSPGSECVQMQQTWIMSLVLPKDRGCFTLWWLG